MISKKSNKKLIIVIILLIVFSFLKYRFIKLPQIEYILSTKYSDIDSAFTDIFLVLWYFPLYLFLIAGELKKYESTNYILRFNKINDYNFFIFKELLFTTAIFVFSLLASCWIESNLTTNYLLDISLYIKLFVFFFTLLLAFLVFLEIYILVKNLFSELLSIIFVIFIGMLEYTKLVGNVILTRIYSVFSDYNFYEIQIKNILYFLSLFLFVYYLNKIALEKIDIKRGEK